MEKTTVLSYNAEALKNKKVTAPTPKNGSRNQRSDKRKEKAISYFAQKMLRIFQKDQEKRIMRQTSAGSANTISNSSLQDMDEIDFSSSDLVKYMEEVNEDLA